MVRDFVQWTASLVRQGDLSELAGTRLGIEAADYLRTRIINHPDAKEPLVPALGGLPMALEKHVEADLKAFEALDIEPRFVFSGLDLGDQGDPFRQKQEEAGVNANAWNLYDNHHAAASVAKFGESTYVTPEDLFPMLQAILTRHKLRFIVAPYSAWAQLAYLQRCGSCAAIAGSANVLLFPCSHLISSWDFTSKKFFFTMRDSCIANLDRYANSSNGNSTVSEELFVDALVLAGTPFLPTLPSLNAPNRNEFLKPHAAIKAIMGGGKTGYSVVVQNQDHPDVIQMQYVDRYRKARLRVKNHPVYTIDGRIEPANTACLPNNAIEYLDARLPDEVHHYMSMGLINPGILQWRTTGRIFDVPPMDGGDSVEYQSLVSTKLTPLRAVTINLLSSSLQNWFRHKSLEQRCWFSDPTTKAQEITIVGVPDTLTIVNQWNVKEAVFAGVVAQYQGRGILGKAILSLQNAAFVPKTVGEKLKKNKLSTSHEMLFNSIWRFLALREYVDAKHDLTPWGHVLAAAMAGVTTKGHSEKTIRELEEATVIAVDLLRLNSLNADISMFPTYNGAPMRGSTQDQQYNMLVSRVAGLLSLQHKPIGFTGPLSQHLLGYNSVINVVRQTLRDMVEVSSTHMLLDDCCDRQALEFSEIAIGLPFLLPVNCALSIAVKSYLDELLSNDADPTSAETKERVLETTSVRYFPQSLDLKGDLATAFQLWDAVYAGVKSGGKVVPEATQTLWTDTDEWLRARR